MSDWLADGMEYDVDGDVIDKRDNKIHSLKLELLEYKMKASSEAALRKENPALEDAWEKYQTVLKLVEHA